ncbi:hypothetical protein C2845_PM05G23840 [Panicum miliaceum]|uniref:Uncharacterized protein n=1 Tax=Panicum miliaceum TaxID=4540 RepID=A0A3L6T3A2_PANMI|nr:hypothetical protein C2845_PM05G23840 [Panicum miliaceum]
MATLSRNRARGRLSDGETAVLIKAWQPLYERRGAGEIDPSVPARWHRRVRSRCIVAADWRAVATAVNAYRDSKSLGSYRDPQQCKGRITSVTKIYWDEYARGAGWSSWRFFPTLGHILNPDGDGQPVSRGPPPAPARPEVPPQDGVADGDVDVESGGDAEDASTMVEPVQLEDVSDGGDTAVDMRGEEDGHGSAAGYVRRPAAAVADHSGGEVIDGLLHIPKRPRTGGSASGAAGTRGGASAAGFLMCLICLVWRRLLDARLRLPLWPRW